MDAACHETNDALADGEVGGPGAPTLAQASQAMIAKRRWQKSLVTGESTYKP